MIGRFIKYIEGGLETDIVELKAFPPPLRDRPLMESIVKEILAVANTGRQGYILFGVNDAANRAKGGKAVPGVDHAHGDDQVEREINDKLSTFSEPRVRIKYASFDCDGKKKIGVLTVLRSNRRPHMVAKNGDKLKRGEYFVRRGTITEVLTPDELREIAYEPDKKYVTLLNFTHTFQDRQIRQLEMKVDCFIEHVWPDCKVDFDINLDFESQARKLVDDLGYTSEEWQDVGSFIVCLPGFSEVAAVLLAELHGRMGQFPTIVRRCKDDQSELGEYMIKEIIPLSMVRDRARREGAHTVALSD